MTTQMIEPTPELMDEAEAIDLLLLNAKGELQVLPFADIQKFTPKALRLWLHLRAIYFLPTVEFITWLKSWTEGRKVIEIAAGNGVLGRTCGWPMFDNKMQEWPEIRSHYLSNGQIPVTYGSDVQTQDALAAVIEHEPELVVAAWATQKWSEANKSGDGNMHGIQEDQIITRASYLHIGSVSTHGQKEIRWKPHQIARHDAMVSRASPSLNVLYYWRKQTNERT